MTQTTFRNSYRELTDDEAAHVAHIKDTATLLERLIAGGGFKPNRIPDMRCISIAQTNLEQAVMWAVKAYT